MTSASSIDSLQSSLGYRFKAVALLEEALTHSSLVNEQKSVSPQHNERLEFLGDAVLSLVMSEYLASALPQFSEGALLKLKAQLVSEASLAAVARRLSLGGHLKLGRGEEALPLYSRLKPEGQPDDLTLLRPLALSLITSRVRDPKEHVRIAA